MSDFPCTQCGLCCRQVGLALQHQDLFTDAGIRAALQAFPYKTDEYGACEKLVDNRCSVYNERPYLCRVDEMAEVHNIDKDEWYRVSARACNFMILEAGLPDSYLIKDYDQL